MKVAAVTFLSLPPSRSVLNLRDARRADRRQPRIRAPASKPVCVTQELPLAIWSSLQPSQTGRILRSQSTGRFSDTAGAHSRTGRRGRPARAGPRTRRNDGAAPAGLGQHEFRKL